jgi:hypothetical protein
MSGRGGRTRGGLVVPAAAGGGGGGKQLANVKASPAAAAANLVAAGTRVSGRSPNARGAAAQQPARGGGAAAGLVRSGGRGAGVRGGAVRGQTPSPAGRGSPNSGRGGGGAGTRASPKPSPGGVNTIANTATSAGGGGSPKPKTGSQHHAVTAANTKGPSEAAAHAKELKALAPTAPERATDVMNSAAAAAAIVDGLDLKLSDFPAADAAAVGDSGESKAALLKEEPAARRRRVVYPKLNENPDAPEVVDVENIKCSAPSAAAAAAAAKVTAKQRSELSAAAATNHGGDIATRTPIKNGGGDEEVGDAGIKKEVEQQTNGEVEPATTNGYGQSLLGGERTTATTLAKLLPSHTASPIKAMKIEGDTLIQVRAEKFLGAQNSFSWSRSIVVRLRL